MGPCAESARLELNYDFDTGGEKEPTPRKPDGGVSRRLWGTKESEKQKQLNVSKTL